VSDSTDQAEIKSWSDLTLDEWENEKGGLPQQCVIVLKANQGTNVWMRTLKAIANHENLSISDLQVHNFIEAQLNLLYNHDIEFDDSQGCVLKSPETREKYSSLFSKGTLAIVVSGQGCIQKVKHFIGEKDPSHAHKDSLRAFYGSDRLDNAFFVSDNVHEALLERDILFSRTE